MRQVYLPARNGITQYDEAHQDSILSACKTLQQQLVPAVLLPAVYLTTYLRPVRLSTLAPMQPPARGTVSSRPLWTRGGLESGSPWSDTTHMPTYLLSTWLPICPHAYLSTHLLTHLPTCLSTYLPTCYLPIYPPAYSSTHLLTHLPTCLSTYLPTCLPGAESLK